MIPLNVSLREWDCGVVFLHFWADGGVPQNMYASFQYCVMLCIPPPILKLKIILTVASISQDLPGIAQL